jgi:hypothetical protein
MKRQETCLRRDIYVHVLRVRFSEVAEVRFYWIYTLIKQLYHSNCHQENTQGWWHQIRIPLFRNCYRIITRKLLPCNNILCACQCVPVRHLSLNTYTINKLLHGWFICTFCMYSLWRIAQLTRSFKIVHTHQHEVIYIYYLEFQPTCSGMNLKSLM